MSFTLYHIQRTQEYRGQSEKSDATSGGRAWQEISESLLRAARPANWRKTDHTMKKGSLQSLAIPEAKWQEVSVDCVTDLPAAVDSEDSIMTVVDRATKMVHLIPCRKTTTAGEAARLYWQHVVKLHGVPQAIHTDRGAQFVGRWWRGDLDTVRHEAAVRDSISSSKPRAG